MKKTRGKKYLFMVNREFQLKYLRYAAMVGFVSTFVTAFIILYPLYVFHILRIPRFLPMPFLIAMGVGIALNIFLVAFVSLIITHRIVGPLFAMSRSFHEIERGKWNSKVHFRKTDELHYVARSFNSMTDGLCKKVALDIAACGDIKQALSDNNHQEGIRLVDQLERDFKKRISSDKEEA